MEPLSISSFHCERGTETTVGDVIWAAGTKARGFKRRKGVKGAN